MLQNTSMRRYNQACRTVACRSTLIAVLDMGDQQDNVNSLRQIRRSCGYFKDKQWPFIDRMYMEAYCPFPPLLMQEQSGCLYAKFDSSTCNAVNLSYKFIQCVMFKTWACYITMVYNLTSVKLSEDPNTLPHRSWMTFLQRCGFCPCSLQTWYSLDYVWKFGLLQFYWAYKSAHLMSTRAWTVIFKTLFADWKFDELASCMPSWRECHRNWKRKLTAIL